MRFRREGRVAISEASHFERHETDPLAEGIVTQQQECRARQDAKGKDQKIFQELFARIEDRESISTAFHPMECPYRKEDRCYPPQSTERKRHHGRDRQTCHVQSVASGAQARRDNPRPVSD